MKSPAKHKPQPFSRVLSEVFVFFFTLSCFLLLSPDAYAHKIHLFCRFEGTTLHGEGFFSGGNPVKNSPINIFNLENGNLLASTMTSDEGTFAVSLEEKPSIQVVLDAGQGHRATWTWDKTSEEAEIPQNNFADAQNPVPAITAGLIAIAVFFGILYLWKQRHAT